MTEIMHEPWCDPRECTADLRQVTAVPDLRLPAHRSTRFTVDLGDVTQGGYRPVGPVLAWLERAAAAGTTTTYLRIQLPGGELDPNKVLTVPITTVYNLAQALDGILGRPSAAAPDYQREDPETGRPLPPHVAGYRVGPVARAVVVAGNAPGRFVKRPGGRVANRV